MMRQMFRARIAALRDARGLDPDVQPLEAS